MKTEKEIMDELNRLKLWYKTPMATTKQIDVMYESKIEILEWILGDR